MLLIFALPILMLLVFLTAAPVAAQNDVRIMDETGRLDTITVQKHAQPLLERGASIAVYVVETEMDDDLLPALESDGLAQDATLPDDLIVIYVALEPKVMRVISGADWSGRLENRGEYVRETTLYDHLDARDYNRVVTDILLRLEVSLQNGEASDDNRLRLMVLGALCLGLIMGSVLQFSGVFK